VQLPQTKKSLGQHWLTDDLTLDAIVTAANVSKADTVLEIGPGAGTLTTKLVKRANSVTAVEFDAELARDLPKRIKTDNLSVVQKDILKFDLTSLPVGYKLVANIPYYLTSNLVRILSESTNPPETAVLLVQKEVAERIAAKPGAMSILSVTSQYYWECSLGIIVPAKLFTPPPKVDSQVIVMKRRSSQLFTDVDEKQFVRLVKAGFSARRKTIQNSLSAGLRVGKGDVAELLHKAGIASNSRPQMLSLEQWHQLYVATTDILTV
jgi:16S rRNA (adenine1518-N6/adenine1519-N6)-dimethyltransferase